MELVKHLNWRYAAKRMTGEKIPQEKLDYILEAIRLSASSAGLQPYTVFVVENPEIREALKTAANNQPQITESSHLLVFAAWENTTVEKIDEYMNLIASERNIPVGNLAQFENTLKKNLLSRSQEDNLKWASRQAYIALGTALAAAAEIRVDATPMEGFNPDQFDEILKLKEKGLRSVVILALGYRDKEKDPLVTAKKVRRQKEQLFINV